MYVFTLTILTDDERIVAVTPWLYLYMYYTRLFFLPVRKAIRYNVNTYPICDSAL